MVVGLNLPPAVVPLPPPSPFQSLEAELRRLQEASAQGLEGFDNRLKKLFYLKIRTEMAVNQEELKILRLGVALNTEREITDKEEELHARLEKSKNKKVGTSRTFDNSALV